MFKALKILLLFGKLRKNFLHFQCRMKGDEQQIVNFITGIEPMLGDHLYLEKQNYPVNLDAPERTVKFSFQRVVGSNKKNVTPLVIFNLMLKMMQKMNSGSNSLSKLKRGNCLKISLVISKLSL